MALDTGLFFLFETLGQISPADFYQQALEESVYGEELGMAAICPAEHHFSEHYGIMPRVEHFLSFVAGRTRKVKLWPMLIVAPLADPIRLAEDTAMIDQMSRGRFVFSVGSGYRPAEFAKFGREMSENAGRLKEITELTNRFYTGEKVHHDGEFYKVDGATLQPRPYEDRIPMTYVTTTRKDVIAWAASQGYGIVPAAGFNASTLKHDYDLHARLSIEAGHQPMSIRPFFKWIYVHEDHKTGVNEGNQYILRTLMAFAHGGGRLFQTLIGKSLDTWTGTEKPEWLTTRVEELMAAGVTYEGMVESGWTPYVCGDPDHVYEVLKPFVEAGGNMFMGGFHCGPMPQEKVRKSMELFMNEVAPRF